MHPSRRKELEKLAFGQCLLAGLRGGQVFEDRHDNNTARNTEDPVQNQLLQPLHPQARQTMALGPALAAAPANLPTRPATAPPPLTIEALPENVFPLRCYSKFFHSRRDDD
ncbi:MAG: hypothetical protein WA866_12645, partial [Pseudolabrys sp.]